MARRTTNLALIERRQNLKLEQQARAREDEADIEAHRLEVVARGEAQGTAYLVPAEKRGERRKPIRRMSGLEWLNIKQRITEDQWAAGLRYGTAYRRAKAEQSLRSILNRDVTSADGPTLAKLLEHAEGTHLANQKLAMYRNQLMGEVSIINACDLVCGDELTPREAANNGRNAEALEALLIAGLNLLLLHLAPSRACDPETLQDVA